MDNQMKNINTDSTHIEKTYRDRERTTKNKKEWRE